jgi:hypothetical protein
MIMSSLAGVKGLWFLLRFFLLKINRTLVNLVITLFKTRYDIFYSVFDCFNKISDIVFSFSVGFGTLPSVSLDRDIIFTTSLALLRLLEECASH